MPRFSTYQQSINDCLTIKISSLNKWGDLKPGKNVYNSKYIWTVRGKEVAKISYSIKTIHDDLKHLVLSYQHGGEPVNYYVKIVAVTTNLGIGKRWYFICPSIGKMCMNLIAPRNSKYFVHRSAFNLLYESQKESKRGRGFNKVFGNALKLDELYSELYQKYRKSHYRGKPTPLMKKILKHQKHEIETNPVFQEYFASLGWNI